MPNQLFRGSYRARLISVETLTSLALLLLMGSSVYLAADFNAQARRIPLVVGVPTVALLVVQVWRDLTDRERRRLSVGLGDDGKTAPPSTMQPQRVRTGEDALAFDVTAAHISVSQAFSWVAFCGFLFLALGMVATSALYIFTFMRIYGRESLWKCVITALAVTGVVYLGFQRLLGLRLYEGVLFGLLL